MEDSDDTALWLAHCRDGDAWALAELLERYSSRLTAVALRVTGNSHDAEDAVQMAVEQILTLNEDQQQAVQNVYAWMMGVVMNCSRGLIRRESRLRNRHHQAGKMQGTVTECTIEDIEADDDRRQLLGTIDTALRDLPAKYQDALTLHYIHGMKFDEVAAALGCSKESVKKQSQRGVKKIRKILERRGIHVAGVLLLSLLNQLQASERVISDQVSLNCFPRIIEAIRSEKFVSVSAVNITPSTAGQFPRFNFWLAAAGVFFSAAVLWCLYTAKNEERVQFDLVEGLVIHQVEAEKPEWKTLGHEDFRVAGGISEEFGDIGAEKSTGAIERPSVAGKGFVWRLRSEKGGAKITMLSYNGIDSGAYTVRYRYRDIEWYGSRTTISFGLLESVECISRVVFRDEEAGSRLQATFGEWRDVLVEVRKIDDGGLYMSNIAVHYDDQLVIEKDFSMPSTNAFYVSIQSGLIEVKDFQVKEIVK